MSRTNGTQYYSDCKTPKSLTSPIQNNAGIRILGHFEQNWVPETRSFDHIGYGLKRTKSNQGRLFCDLTQTENPNDQYVNRYLPNINNGFVSFTLSFPYAIINSVLQTNQNALLWAVTEYGKILSYPSCSAYFDRNGLHFRLLNGSDLDLIMSDINLPANTKIKIEFYWGKPIEQYDYANTFVIIDGEVHTIGFTPLLEDEENKSIVFCGFDYPTGGSQFECTIHEIKLGRYSDLPDFVIKEMSSSNSSSSSLDSSSSSSSSSDIYSSSSYSSFSSDSSSTSSSSSSSSSPG